MFLRVSVIVASSLVLCACASGGARIAKSGDSNTRSFIQAAGTWDFDRNGTVSCDEWKGYATRQFGAADSNTDGKLEYSEYKTLSSRDSMFGSVSPEFFDRNKDTRISKAEFVDTPNPAFASLDADKDCNLTIAELAAVPRKRSSKVNDSNLFPGEARGNTATPTRY